MLTVAILAAGKGTRMASTLPKVCLLYTSDAADERSSVDLGGRRIIKRRVQEQLFSNLQTSKKWRDKWVMTK